MGYNTTVMFLNDNWHKIKDNPQAWVDSIDHAMHDGDDHAFGQTTVMKTGHADEPRLYFSHRNSLIELSAWSRQTQRLLDRADHIPDSVRNDIECARMFLDNLEKMIDKEYPKE